MTHTTLLPILLAASSAVALSGLADAQTRAVPRGGSVVIGQAVPRPAPAPGPRGGGGPVVAGPRGGAFTAYRPYYGRPYYGRPYYPVRSGFSIGVFAGYPLGYYPYPYPYVASGYYAPPATTYVVQAPPAVVFEAVM